ncbi:DUF427 domain-containing protein [Nocardia sp. NPDC127579]|uniref:DUF427 domain-containing protein n=1 Tax=Nocardia sp. NPDC127579 TaxID=3345402 RepID=UPI0036307F98
MSDPDVKVVPCAERVWVLLHGHLVADSRSAMLVWEHPYYPTYYLPALSGNQVRNQRRRRG